MQEMIVATSTTSSDVPEEQACWYAIRTRPRHEKRVAAELQEKGITTYLPLLRQLHRWTDRRQVVHVPLFSCYAFVHAVLDLHLRMALYNSTGALGFVGPNNRGVPIPDVQIESVRTLMSSNALLSPHPLLKVGQRVRVRGGALNGIEGILSTKGERRLVVAVDSVNIALSIDLEGYDVEPV